MSNTPNASIFLKRQKRIGITGPKLQYFRLLIPLGKHISWNYTQEGVSVITHTPMDSSVMLLFIYRWHHITPQNIRSSQMRNWLRYWILLTLISTKKLHIYDYCIWRNINSHRRLTFLERGGIYGQAPLPLLVVLYYFNYTHRQFTACVIMVSRTVPTTKPK